VRTAACPIWLETGLTERPERGFWSQLPAESGREKSSTRNRLSLIRAAQDAAWTV